MTYILSYVTFVKYHKNDLCFKYMQKYILT